METNNLLALNDTILKNILGFVSNNTTRPIMKVNGLRNAANNSLTNFSFSELEKMKTNDDIYGFWQNLLTLASEKAKTCTASYEQLAAKVISLEDQKNQCYAKGDQLKKNRDSLLAQKASLDSNMASLQKQIADMESEIAQLQQKIRSLEKDKEIYDILRWIPFVNIISEIIAAIDGTRDQLDVRKRELAYLYSQCDQLNQERQKFHERIAAIQNEMNDNTMEIAKLEELIKSCLAQRESASKEMIAWKDREQYYLNVAGEMEHLMAMDADIEALKKLIMDNPPAFDLVA